MAERDGLATGKQPITAWRCEKCGMISEMEWVGGNHADRSTGGLNKKCYGKATGPYYLISADQYLDVMLERA